MNGTYTLSASETEDCVWEFYDADAWQCDVDDPGSSLDIHAEALTLANGNYGWRVTATVTKSGTGGLTGDDATFEWDSGGSAAFDCTAQRSATWVGATLNYVCFDLSIGVATWTIN